MAANILILSIVGNNIVLFGKYVYGNKTKLKTHLLFVASYTLIITIIGQLMVSPRLSGIIILLKILAYVVTYALIHLILKLGFKKSILVMCISILSMLLGERIVLLVLWIIGINIQEVVSGQNVEIYLLGNLCINLFQMLVLYYIRILKNVSHMANSIKNRTYLMLVANLVLSGSAILINSVMAKVTNEWNMIILYGGITLICVVCNTLSINMVLEVDMRDEKLKIQEQYNELLIDLKHKFFGIVSIIVALIDQKDYEGLKKYAEELNKDFISNLNKIPLSVRNVRLAYLLANKITEAESKGIKLKIVCPAEINGITGIRESDLIYILNELITNAIKHSGCKSDNEIYILIDNNSKSTRVILENVIINTNEDNTRKIGGYGLKQIRKLLPNNVYFKTSAEENLFRAELVISNKCDIK